jgi:ABC-type nitrate/sulfonate/bicarbonate transport system permease component
MGKKLPLESRELSTTSAMIPELDNPPTPKESKTERSSSTPKRQTKIDAELSPSKKLAIFLVSLGTFLASWELAAYMASNSAILAGPARVFEALLSLLQIGSSSGSLGVENIYGALLETIEVVVLAVGLSIAVGIPVGVFMGRWKAAEGLIGPWVSATNSIPIIVLIPSVYFSIGGGFLADVFVSFVLSVFTMIMNTHAGIRYISNMLAEVGRTFRANEIQFITKIALPASLPDIFAGARIAVGRALLGAVMAEALLGGNHGLGGFMTTFEEILNTPSMMATVVLIALVGILLLQAPKLLERRLFRWKESERISRRIGN